MRQHLRPKPNLSNPLPSPTEVIRPQPQEAGAYTDLAYLAERFAAHGGGKVSPELSADLALEVVLNEIVEQACLATGATGAAIVLLRDGEMVCRASNGATAPNIGSRLDPSSGISGKCIRTFLTQRCADVLADPHADLEASLRLGIRSVLIMPLLRFDKLLGIFELFSSRPAAFGERDERTLEALVTRTLVTLGQALEPLAVPVVSALSSGEVADHIGEIEKVENEESMTRDAAAIPARGADFITLMLGAAVLICAILLGVLVGRHFGFLRIGERARATPASTSVTSAPAQTAADSAAAAQSLPAGANNPDMQSAVDTSQPTAQLKPADSAPAPGGLQVYENGKEIFQLSPGQPQPRLAKTHQLQTSQSQALPTKSVQAQPVHAQAAPPLPVQIKKVQPQTVRPLARQTSPPLTPAAAQQNISAAPAMNQNPSVQSMASVPPERVVELSPAEAEDSLLSRVEPEYPDQARQDNIQGDVLLEVRIGTDGTVEGVQLLSGPQQLAQASSDAVRQWRFKPHMLNGQAVKMQTRVTLSFRLPG